MSQNSYQLITLTANIVLSWPSSFGSGPVVCDINDVNTAQNGYTITMPNATLVPNGTSAIFNNISGYSFTILASDGTTITSVATGVIYNLYLYNNSTTNGSWRVIASGGGASSITTFTAESTDSSINISNGTVTAPSGTINFKLPGSLTALNSVSNTGLPVISAINNGVDTWSTVSITAGDNILITNGNGVDGNPVINVNPSMTALTAVTVGNVYMTGSSISPVGSNTGLSFTSNGTGTLTFNGITIDGSSNITSVNNLTINGTLTNSFIPVAWCMFTDTIIGTSGNIIVKQDGSNVTSITGAGGAYTINFATPLSNNKYGVLVTVGTDITGATPIVNHGFSIYAAQTVNSCRIAVVDASGEFVIDAPRGITVQILSSS
jgi:hypothetical protein